MRSCEVEIEIEIEVEVEVEVEIEVEISPFAGCVVTTSVPVSFQVGSVVLKRVTVRKACCVRDLV